MIAIVKHDGQVEAAKQLGAAHVVQTSSIRKAIRETRALTPKNRGVDIAIEAVGVPEAWEEAVEMVRKGGTVNFFGGCAVGTHVTLDTNRIHYSDITLRATFHHTPAICRKALDLIASGRFQAGAFITGHAHLYELNRVFEKLMNREQRDQDRHCALRRTNDDGRDCTRTDDNLAREDLIARGWAALPAVYRIPDNAPTLEEARAWCKHLAETHYENFHVASWFLPEALRPHFHAIYAYCRVSDDLGDEVGDSAQSLALARTFGAVNWTRATKVERGIRCLSLWRKPFAPAAFRKSRSRIC